MSLGPIVNLILIEYEQKLAELAAVRGASVEETKALVNRIATQTKTPRTIVIDVLYQLELEGGTAPCINRVPR